MYKTTKVYYSISQSAKNIIKWSMAKHYITNLKWVTKMINQSFLRLRLILKSYIAKSKTDLWINNRYKTVILSIIMNGQYATKIRRQKLLTSIFQTNQINISISAQAIRTNTNHSFQTHHHHLLLLNYTNATSLSLVESAPMNLMTNHTTSKISTIRAVF